ncbi:jg15084 [Pararge aegeria aegeria]|uniref:Jg15084 protein n=1 Tax=Pararge aegeria aegeria TaxID=348720 RepID=A0A8S4REJ7_9NEOP|nr:jg15084 [Pararge aegeria aegeria]
MESPKIVYKYYSNPAFCAQSEVVFAQKSCVTKIVSPNRRMPPLGGNSPRKMETNRIMRTDISDNPLRIQPGRREEPPELPPKPAKYQFHRQASMVCKPSRSVVRCRTRSEDLEMAQFRQSQQIKYERNAESDDNLEDSRTRHRYDIRSKYNRSADCDDILEDNRLRHRYEIDVDDGIDYSPTKKRIVEADESEIEEYNVDGPDQNELKEIPTEIVKTVNGRTHRYAIVPSDDEDVRRNVTFTSPQMTKKNLIATQKLHELLSTPRKLKSYASQPSVRMTPNKVDSPRYPGTPMKIISSTPTKVTPSKSCANLTLSRNITPATSPISPKAQQKLNYGLSDYDRQDVFMTSFRDKRERSFEMDRRENSRESRSDRRVEQRRDKNTAVIIPRVAAQSPSVYSEDTYKSFSSVKTNATAASLTIAALMLTLCGGLTAGLSFYMMYTMGRRYYLDFGVLSGFTCFLLGLLGFRSRRNQLLPNRNYISGYIVLSSFSLLSAFGLLILLVVQPKPGTALNDITSGAVCSISILSLCLASVGILASYCCARDPPDNRVGTARWY